MADREKLIEFLDSVQQNGVVYMPSQMDDRYGTTKAISNAEVADHLVANDVVPVVRCKDCKYRTSSEFCECREPDAFCNDGERKDEGVLI